MDKKMLSTISPIRKDEAWLIREANPRIIKTKDVVFPGYAFAISDVILSQDDLTPLMPDKDITKYALLINEGHTYFYLK